MKNDKIEPKTDCFAYPAEGKTECYCLNKCYCKKGEKCTFYKPKSEISIAQIESSLLRYGMK